MKAIWQVALGISLAAAATPSTALSKHDRAADERAINTGERAWGHAYVTGDVAAVGRLLAENFRGVDPHGTFYDKLQVVKDVQAVPHGTSDEVGMVEVRFYGDTAIAQAHEFEVGPAPERKAGEHVFTDTWVKIGGHWRIVAAEDVEVKSPSATR